MEQRRLELLTSALRTRRSAKLSYCPMTDPMAPNVSNLRLLLL